MVNGRVPGRPRRDDHFGPHLLDSGPGSVIVIPLVGKHRHGGPPQQERAGLRAIVGLSASQNEVQRIAVTVTDQVDLGA